MARSGSGALSERVVFQRRGAIPDGHGNEIAGDWTDQFDEPARLRPRIGGEEVLGARLTGVQPFVLTVRSSARTRTITPAWRAVDARTGTVYEITSLANTDERNGYIEMMAIDRQAS